MGLCALLQWSTEGSWQLAQMRLSHFQNRVPCMLTAALQIVTFGSPFIIFVKPHMILELLLDKTSSPPVDLGK